MSIKLLSSTAFSKDEIGEQEQTTKSSTRSKRSADNRLSQVIPPMNTPSKCKNDNKEINFSLKGKLK